MKKYAILAFCLMILAAGGVLTVIEQSGGISNFLPTLQQTADPSGSTMSMEGWQAEQLVLLIGFVLFNIIGIAATLALIMFLLHRTVKSVKVDGEVAEGA